MQGSEVAIGLVTGILGLVAIIVSAFVVAKSTSTRATIQLQDENIKALFDKQKIQEEEIQKLKLKNAELQAELDTFKTVPLSQLAKNQTDTTQLIKVIADNQLLIMKKLEVS